jgi:hypothetical protein
MLQLSVPAIEIKCEDGHECRLLTKERTEHRQRSYELRKKLCLVDISMKGTNIWENGPLVGI